MGVSVEMTEQYLTVEDVAKILRVSRWSVGRYIETGALKAIKAEGPKGAIRIPLSSLTAYIEAHTVTAKERTQ